LVDIGELIGHNLGIEEGEEGEEVQYLGEGGRLPQLRIPGGGGVSALEPDVEGGARLVDIGELVGHHLGIQKGRRGIKLFNILGREAAIDGGARGGVLAL
jgi:hypothetical protein